MTDHPVVRVLHRTLDVLDSERIVYATMGGIAIRYWALPRPTYDVDFAVAIGDDAMRRLLGAFEREGFSVDRAFLSGFTDSLAGMRKVAVTLFDAGSAWRVDLFLGDTPLLESALGRRVSVELEGRTVYVLTAEDLLLLKLLAWRPKDQADVEDLLLVCGPLDAAYLRRWADGIHVRERFEDAWRRAGRSD